MIISSIPSIITSSPNAAGNFFLGVQQGSTSSTTNWFSANSGLFVPFNIERPVLVKRMFVMNGNVLSGSVDAGIFTMGGGKIIANGGTVQAGASLIQFLDVTDTILAPGAYYMGCSLNNTTGRIKVYSLSGRYFGHLGAYQAPSVYPLPINVTYASLASLVVPLMGIELEGIK